MLTDDYFSRPKHGITSLPRNLVYVGNCNRDKLDVIYNNFWQEVEYFPSNLNGLFIVVIT